jgi:hypothetical protein
MGGTSKVVSLLLVVILAVSNLMKVESAISQTIPKPSVPEYTLKLVDHSYDVPSTTITSTDPYTGKQTVTTHPGYRVQNKSIEVTIKNQQFTPYSIDNQHTIYLFYNFSYKGHYASDWNYYPSNGSYAWDSDAATNIPQSTSDYTVIPFTAPTEGQMDFRVQAQIGYYDSYQEYIPVPGSPFTHYTFTGEASGWSNAQTITIPDTSSLSLLIAVIVVSLAIIIALVLLFFRRHRKTPALIKSYK